MGIGTSMRSAVTSTINGIGSTITFTPFTQSTSDSGYSGQVESDQSPSEEIAIPFEEFKDINKQIFGDLETGGFQLAIKHDTTFEISGNTKYKITYQNEVYDLISFRRYAIEDVLVAFILSLSKRLD